MDTEGSKCQCALHVRTRKSWSFWKKNVEWKSQDLLVQPGGQLDKPGTGRENLQIRIHQEKKNSSIKIPAKPKLLKKIL